MGYLPRRIALGVKACYTCDILLSKEIKTMEMNKWLKLVEQDVNSKRDSNIVMDSAGNEYDVMMSQRIGDEWFFGFANSDLDEIVPKFCMESAMYAVANNCLIRLMLTFEDPAMLEDLLKQSIVTAQGMIDNRKEKP